MADDVTKKILIDVQLKQNQLKSDIVGLNSALDQLLIQQVKLQGQSKQNTAEYVGLTSQIRLAKAEIRDANKQVDNMSKALNAENNSIQQNRALLSVLTAQYVKLGQEEGKAAKSTVELGTTISKLTETLKTQEKQIGQTYRNVGNYEQAFQSALGTLGQFIPGFQKFNTAITTVVKGFGFLPNAIKKSDDSSAKLGQTMGFLPQKFGDASKSIETFTVKGEQAAATTTQLAEAAPAAEEGVAALGVSAGLLAGIFAVVAGAIVAVVGYMKQLDGVTDIVEQGWNGLKYAFLAAGMAIQNGKWGEIGKNMLDATIGAIALTDALQTLGDQQLAYSVVQKKNEEEIGVLQLKLRDRRNTPAQEKSYYDQIQAIGEENYKHQKKLADDQYSLAVYQATIGTYLTKQEIKNLKQRGVAYAIELENENKIFAKQTHAIADAQNAQTAAEQYYLMVKQRSQNRIDAYNMKQEAASEKERALLEKIKQETEQANSERIASITRMLEFQQDAFGKELSSTNEHYRQLIFKQQQFVERQQAIANNPKYSAKVRTAAGGAIQAGKADIDQLQKEQYIATEKMLVEHNKSMIDMATKAALELRSIQITNIRDNQKREIAAVNNDLEIQKHGLEVEHDQLEENLRKIQNELTANDAKEKNDKSRYTAEEVQALKTTLNEQYALLADNEDKREALIKATNDKIDQINKHFYDMQNSYKDKTAILDAEAKTGITGGKNNPFNSDEQKAKHQQLLDEYNSEVTTKGLTDDAKLELEKQFLAADKDLTEQNEKDKKDIILQFAQQAQNAVFSIISNNIKSQAQARQTQLSKDKDHELANSSLTSAQKLSINDKYRKLEGQEKVREFKADQKLSLAKAAIETAESILKASPIIPLMALAAATGVAEIGVIASQKPPAYATGGLHQSDGRGSLLPGYSRHDNVNAQLRSGEAVVVSEAMQDPWARNLVSAINVMYGGRDFSTQNPGRGYAIGGVVTDGGNANRYYAQPQAGTENLANSIAFSLINNFPPVIVDVKDINSQQGIKAKTVNRVNL